ncbi:MAG: ArsA family ATPase [Dehalococcoides mccartyi]|uniref:ArsA family ATPase n=1 Tax=Dehalococcoides TaxID=61434 RepID=UPI0027378792|nr:ArsA family ATPase [Dehalococcoides mccartyi]MDP4280201.1 ArsA family ATPase [Dehalococcoides mccartyi]
MGRVLLFTGKGGVGKTTITAATALAAAKRGYKTVVMSTDTAHSLGDSLDCQLGPEPRQVSANLWAQESNVLYNLESHWGTVKRWLAALMAWRGVDEIVAEEIAVLPGIEELANLLWVYNYEQQGDYDVILVDCAPTGESLRLLTFPEVMQWWINKLLPVGRKLMPVTFPIIHRFTDMPLPDEQIFSTIDELFQQLEGLRSLLTNPQVTTIRLVMNPEKMVIKEAQRTYTYLNLYGYPTDAVICNRIIPQDADGSYWEKWKESQAEYLHFIEERFSPLPILKVPLLKNEVVGTEALEEIGRHLYGDDDPTHILFEGKTMSISREDTGYVINMPLPFVAKGDVSLMRNGDELVATIGSQRHSILLPQVLLACELKGAKLDDGHLRIRFAGAAQPQDNHSKGE